MSKIIKVGLCGAGTVGGGVVKILAKNKELITARATQIDLVKVADKNTSGTRELLDAEGLTDVPVLDDWHSLVEDPEIDIIVELIGNINVAHEFILAALNAGKSVVTANKDLMAAHGGELLEAASNNQVDLFFEAAVAGGIPIIQPLKESLAGNRIHKIMGIINGTTNYILSKMAATGADFQSCLKEAQELGYAEADPTNDIEGYDAARKIAILASIAFNSRVSDDMVSVEGISGISDCDITYARELGYVIKMLGIAVDGDEIEVRVHPAMIPQTHPLASVLDSYNAVFVEADALGNAMFYGRGAGQLPTGSAVVGDIICAARNIVHNAKCRWGCTCFLDKKIKPLAETQSKYYIRLVVKDEPGVLANITRILGENKVSMESVIQKRRLAHKMAEIVMITHRVKHAYIQDAMKGIADLDSIFKIENTIRVEDEE